jgi:hypothetical protein
VHELVNASQSSQLASLLWIQFRSSLLEKGRNKHVLNRPLVTPQAPSPFTRLTARTQQSISQTGSYFWKLSCILHIFLGVTDQLRIPAQAGYDGLSNVLSATLAQDKDDPLKIFFRWAPDKNIIEVDVQKAAGSDQTVKNPVPFTGPPKRSL